MYVPCVSSADGRGENQLKWAVVALKSDDSLCLKRKGSLGFRHDYSASNVFAVQVCLPLFYLWNTSQNGRKDPPSTHTHKEGLLTALFLCSTAGFQMCTCLCLLPRTGLERAPACPTVVPYDASLDLLLIIFKLVDILLIY